MLMSTHVAVNKGITDPRFLNPALLKKFLVAKDFNIEKATKLFDNYWAYRGESQIDKVIELDWSKLEQFRALYPRSFYFNDMAGRPVLVEKVGKAKFSEIFKVRSADPATKSRLLS